VSRDIGRDLNWNSRKIVSANSKGSSGREYHSAATVRAGEGDYHRERAGESTTGRDGERVFETHRDKTPQACPAIGMEAEVKPSARDEHDTPPLWWPIGLVQPGSTRKQAQEQERCILNAVCTPSSVV